jgi:hypothetical protein
MNLKSKISSLEKEIQIKCEKINKYKSKYKHYKHINHHKRLIRVDNEISIRENELKSSVESIRLNTMNKDAYDK